MAIYNTIQELKNAVSDSIYQNSSGIVTAEVIQERLLDMIDTLNKLPVTGLASQTWVTLQIANMVGSAPEALDTLYELAAALNNDKNFATTVINSLATKADLVAGVVPLNQLPDFLTEAEALEIFATINNPALGPYVTIEGATRDADTTVLKVGHRAAAVKSGTVIELGAMFEDNCHIKLIGYSNPASTLASQFGIKTIDADGIWHTGIYQNELGNVGFGNEGASDTRVTIKGVDSGVNHALVIKNAADSDLLRVRNDGLVTIPLGGGYLYTYGRFAAGNAGKILFNNGTGANLALKEKAANVYTFGNGDTLEALSMNMATGDIGTSDFVSGFSGSGWQNEIIDGKYRLTVDELTVRGRMSVYELQVNKIRATNGSLWVTDAFVATADLANDAGGWYMKCEDASYNTLQENDIIRAQAFNGNSVYQWDFKVAVSAADYVYVTLVNGGVIPAEQRGTKGKTFVRIGNATNAARQNAIYLTASDDNNPYLDVLTGINSTSFAGKTRLRLGNLAGINDADFGALTGMGLYGENIYLKGKFKIVAGSGYDNLEDKPISLSDINSLESTALEEAYNSINNLQIGGRNLYKKTTVINQLYGTPTIEKEESADSINGFKITGESGGADAVRIANVIDENGEYTVSFYFKANGTGTLHLNLCDVQPYSGEGSFTEEWKYFEFKFLVNNYSETYHFLDVENIAWMYYWFKNFKIEKGNIATDWTPAEEDVKAGIDAAAAAAVAAQSSANTANSAVASLNNYVDGAFEDGVIEASEAKAIEKYINVINDSKTAAENQYNTLYVNTYLEGTAKTNLLNAKITLLGAIDNLLASVNSAIADGKTTAAEKADVDAKYSLYITTMGSYKAAVEAAGKAIQDKLDTLSTNKVDAIQIGGRNLFRNGDYCNGLFNVGQVFGDGTIKEVVIDTRFGHALKVTSHIRLGQLVNSGLRLGTPVTLSFYAKATSPVSITFAAIGFDGSSGICTNGKAFSLLTTWQYCSFTFTAEADLLDNENIYFYLPAGDSNPIYFSQIFVGEGNKPLAWHSAEEDVAAKIAAVDSKANISKAITDKFGTTVDGGLINTVMTLLRELNSNIETAGISGIQGANKDLPAVWMGGTYANAIAGTAGIILRHNATGKIGVFEVDSLGNVKVYDPDDATLIRILFSKNNLPTIANMMGAANLGGSATNAENLSLTALSTLANTINVTESGASIVITGTMSTSVGVEFGYTEGDLTTYIWLYKDGAVYWIIEQDFANLLAENETYSKSITINKTFESVPAGVYSIVIQRLVHQVSGTSGLLGTSTMIWEFDVVIKRFEFAKNGYMAFYQNHHMYFSEGNGLDIRGLTNMPGALCKGRVASNGDRDSSYLWGAKNNALSSVQIIATGQYRVPVAIVTGFYSVFISPRTASRVYYMGDQTTTYFDVFFTNLSGAPASCEFDYECVGKNYA